MSLKRITEFRAGHDCIKFECKYDSDTCKPGGGGSHGIHGLNIAFIVKGKEGAVQFVLYTGWLPQTSETHSIIGYRELDFSKCGEPMPADLGYHSKKPHYQGQDPIERECKYTDGEPCYYDGSGLNANDAMYALCNGGDEALWRFLEGYYRCVFIDGVGYPTAPDYPKPLRNKS